MGTAALTARFALPHRARRAGAAACGLAFDEPGGPIVAVCGLVGGSGASTLAFCLARQAARESRTPVLLTEPDARRAGLTVLAGRSTPLCLSGLAERVAEGRAPAEPFVEIDHGLRLVASAPRRGTDAAPEHVSALICEAKAAHGLVVVDCGTSWITAIPVLDAATHILWTVTASTAAVARARLLLASDALPAPGRARELLVVLASDRRSTASVRALRRLAAQRCERLVLAPCSNAVVNGDLAHPADSLGRTLTGIAAILRSDR
jgi:hypothetical protein